MSRIGPVKNGESGSPDDDRAAAAAYLAAMTAELAAVARRHHLNTLGYLLDMARIEAEGTSKREGTSESA